MTDCLSKTHFPKDAGSLDPRAGADFTRLSSRDLYGAGSRLHSTSDHLASLGLASAARHYAKLAAIEDAGKGLKTGQSTPQPQLPFLEVEDIWPKGRAR